MGNARKSAKKALAVFSAAALLLSGSATGAVTILSDAVITANAADTASATVTQLKIYDENGNDISDNPIIYVDNSNAALGITSRTIKVVATNENGDSVDDVIQCFGDSGFENNIRVTGAASSKKEITVTIAGGYFETKNGTSTWTSLNAGDTKLNFTTAGGKVFRPVTVKVYNPATDLKVKQNGTPLDLNDYSEDNSDIIMAIANHQYQFNGEKVPASSTDEIEWSVINGYYEEGKGINTTDYPEIGDAEITQNGLFTPKRNGQVTIVVKYKATETSDRTVFYGTKKVWEDEAHTKSTTIQNYKNGPKYIHVTVVKENPAKDIKITTAPSALEVGETFQLKYAATPTYTGQGYESGATDDIKWTSSNEKVVKVDQYGLVTAIGKGDAKITVKGEGDNIYAQCDIKVLTKATSISFDTTGKITTRVGVDTELTAIMAPVTADDEVVWESADPSIATVRSAVTGDFTNQQKAVITGVKKGTVEITARAKNSGVERKILCTVEDRISSTDINLSTQQDNTITTINEGTNLQVFNQQELTIDGILVAADGTTPDDTLKWEVLDNGLNNGDYVTIVSQNSKSIKLKGFAKGKVRIKASSIANSSITKTFTIEILQKADKGNIVEAETDSTSFKTNLNVGSSIALSANIYNTKSNNQNDHDDYVASWTSNNESVATVDNNGFVQIVGNGKATITMKTASGYGLTKQFIGFTTSSIVLSGVTAGDPIPTAIVALDKKGVGSATLKTTIYDENDKTVSSPAVTWTSSDESIATVDANGKVTGLSLGDTIITAKSGNKSQRCLVSVTLPIGNANISIESSVEYSPFAVSYEPEVIITNPNEDPDLATLIKGVDYTVEYSNNTTVGQKGTVTITGLGYYKSSAPVTKTFTITQKSLKSDGISVSAIADQEITAANKSGVKPSVTVKQQTYTLTEGTDYTLTYKSNTKPGTATVTITGKGNYKDAVTAQYTIYCKHTTTTEKITKQPTYTAPGEKTITCSICGHTTKAVVPMLTQTSIKNCTITLSKSAFVANGSVQVPTVTVKKGTTVLKANTDYTLKFSNSSSKEPGKYSVTITGKGGYKDAVVKNYTITVNVTSVKVSKTSATLGVGESLTIKATVTPSAAATWSSSNTSVATVVNGKITAKKAGTAVITAKAGTKSATCKITVKKAPTKVTLSKTSATLGVSKTLTLKATLPSGTASNTLTYKSSNTSVATVSSTGKITAKKAGTATITVTTFNGKKATCKVTVKNLPTSVKLNKTYANMKKGGTLTLKATVSPSSNVINTVTWISSNTKVATVKNGKVTAKAKGTVTITVKTTNGKTAKCTITIK